MMKLGFVVVALVGCGAKPAEPLERPTPIAPNELRLAQQLRAPLKSTTASDDGPGLSLPRPSIETAVDPPDVNDLGRWPLTIAEHPALEPHFDIASALAEPGVTWTDLCARGAQHRHLAVHQELVTYLDAWCSVVADDYSAAIVKLGFVRHVSNRQLLEALRLDVAAIVAAHGSAHDLESFLRAGGFLETDEVDVASAAFFEVGKLDEAAEANKLAEDMDPSPAEAVRCARMMRAIADTTSSARQDELDKLRLAAMVPPHDIRTPHCRLQYEIARCWSDADCNGYWSTLVPSEETEGVTFLGTVYRSWATFRTSNDWRFAAARLNYAHPLRDRYRLMVPALELSARLSRCDLTLVSDLEESIRLGLADLSPQPSASSSHGRRAEDLERLHELGKLTTEEVKTWRTRLDAALALVQHLWKLDPSACSKYVATLPPVQP